MGQLRLAQPWGARVEGQQNRAGPGPAWPVDSVSASVATSITTIAFIPINTVVLSCRLPVCFSTSWAISNLTSVSSLLLFAPSVSSAPHVHVFSCCCTVPQWSQTVCRGVMRMASFQGSLVKSVTAFECLFTISFLISRRSDSVHSPICKQSNIFSQTLSFTWSCFVSMTTVLNCW